MAVLVAAAALKYAGANLLVSAIVIAAAAYVDATVIAPMFMDEPKDGANFGSWEVTYAEEGTPMKWAYGPENRISGQVVMAGRPWVTKSGGGGGKRREPVQYTYWTDVIFALTSTQFYRVDRMDTEGNTSYIRDVSTTVTTSWALSLTRFHYAFGGDETTLVWQRTGAAGSSTEWSLVQWHGTITNQLPYQFQELGHFMPGERLKVTGATDLSGVPGVGSATPNDPSVGFGSFVYRKQAPGATRYVKIPRVHEDLVCVASRNIGYAQVPNIAGGTQTVARTKLVIDFLGEKDSYGLLRDRLVTANLTLGTFPQTNDYFYQGVSTGNRNSFTNNHSNAFGSPLNYQPGSGAVGWPRALGAGQPVTIEYQSPRNWALDVMRTQNPVAGVDYVEHVGGAQTTIDPIYEAQVGSDEVPSLPQLGYFSMANLNLSRFGNRIPQAHFYVDCSERVYNPATQTVVSAQLLSTKAASGISTGAIDVLMQRHGNLPASSFDTTSKVDQAPMSLRGMSFGGLHEVHQLISSVCMVADIYPQEWSGKVRFFSRAQRPVVNASWQMLDARRWNSPPSPMLDITDQDIRKIPKRVHLKFSDVDKDMQAGDVYAYRDSITQRWTQNTTGDTNEVETRRVTIPNLVLSDDQARPVAERILSDMQSMRQRVRVRLPSWFQIVTEGDVVKLDDYEITQGHRGQTNPLTGASRYQNRDWWIVVEQVDIGADFFVEVEGVLWPDDPRSFELESSAARVGGGYGSTGSGEPARMRDFELKEKLEYNPPSIVVAVDIPPVLDDHASKTGIYFAYAAPGAFSSQPSGSLLEAIGDGDDYIDVAPADRSAIMGRVIGRLGDGPVDVQTTRDSFTVELLATDYASGGLASTDDAGLARGLNFACVGSPGSWEIIQFKTVTDAGDERYVLSDLRRGLRGSERYTGTHERGEWFVLLDHRRLHFMEFGNELVGTTRRYKVAHSTLDSSTPAIVTLQGWTSLPLPVAALTAWRKSNGDIVFDWNRRTRARYRTLGTQVAPLMEATESYDVVIDLGADRTINVTDTRSATYTAAMQTEDGTSGAEITATVYQRDSVRGRGQPAEIIVAQTQAEVGTEDGNVLGTENTHTLNTPIGGGTD